MAQTTTAINACDAVLKVDDDGGTPVDVSGSSNQANLSLSKQLGKGVTFDGDWNFVLECKKDGSLELRIMYTKDNSEGYALLRDWFTNGGNRTISVYPAGEVAGESYFTGEFKLGEMQVPVSASEAGPIVVSATCQPDGAITFTTVAT